jgi:hypothetical protein
MGEGMRDEGRCYGIREVKGHGWLRRFREEGSSNFLTLRGMAASAASGHLADARGVRAVPAAGMWPRCGQEGCACSARNGHVAAAAASGTVAAGRGDKYRNTRRRFCLRVHLLASIYNWDLKLPS